MGGVHHTGREDAHHHWTKLLASRHAHTIDVSTEITFAFNLEEKQEEFLVFLQQPTGRR